VTASRASRKSWRIWRVARRRKKQLAEYDTKLATLDKEAEHVLAEYIRRAKRPRSGY
jgi:hypothetical protein